MKTYQKLIKNLKEERKPKIYSYFNVDEQKTDSDRFNIFKYRKNIKKNDSKNNLLYDGEVTKKNNPKETKNQEENIIEKLRKLYKRNRHDSEIYPNHYNPNYNSIMKKIPCVKIIKPPEINNKRPTTTFLTGIGELAVSSNKISNKKNRSLNINNRRKRQQNPKNIDSNNKELQAMILCPTRELAIQVAEELKKLSKYLPKIDVFISSL